MWIGDEKGQPVPFVKEGAAKWIKTRLELSDVIIGADESGHPTIEFSPGKAPSANRWLTLKPELEGVSPWLARVEISRKVGDGEFLVAETDKPLHLFDLGKQGRRESLDVTWDAERYRVRLVAVQGPPPKITGLTVETSTRPVRPSKKARPDAHEAQRDGA